MNRDVHRRGFESGATAGATQPAAGKQTLSERGAESPHAAPLQCAETGPAQTKDPSQAFATAASGSFSEIPYRAEMEQRFEADFSSVQSFAGRGLDDLGALAATRGEQVVFQSGSPDRQTVAHELTHVLQSRQGLASGGHGGGKAMSDPGDASEREARGVAASLDGPETGQTKPSAPAVSAAPSGAIHRQENTELPPTPHLSADGADRGRPIAWDRTQGIAVSATQELPAPASGAMGSIREIYNYNLLHNLPIELPGEITAYLAAGHGPLPLEDLPSGSGRGPRATAVESLLAFLNTRMANLRWEGDEAAAEDIRVPLFRACQQALVATLDVENAPRYQQTFEGEEMTQTFCNVFAYDMVTAMGAYLPRVWWSDVAAARESALDPEHNTVQLNANSLYQWMLDWGAEFGWVSVGAPDLAQDAANDGKVVIILGGLGDPGTEDPGHVSVVLCETAEQEAARLAAGGATIPLQAQAGADNYSNNRLATGPFRSGTATTGWWDTFPVSEAQEDRPSRDEQLGEGGPWTRYATGAGFFVYEGPPHGEISIRTPEQMGFVLPEAVEPVPEATPEATAEATPEATATPSGS